MPCRGARPSEPVIATPHTHTRMATSLTQAANALLGGTLASELTPPELALAMRTGEFSSGGIGGGPGSEGSDGELA